MARKTVVVLLVVVTIASGIAVTFTSDPDAQSWSPQEGVKVWNGSGSTNAKDPDNWMPRGAPTDGQQIVFNSTSSYNCVWNLPLRTGSFSLDPGFRGIVTLASNLWTDDFSVDSGTLNANPKYLLTVHGDYTQSGSVGSSGKVASDVLRIRMVADGGTIRGLQSSSILSLQVSANVQGEFLAKRLVVDPGRTLTVTGFGRVDLYSSPAGYLWNLGTIRTSETGVLRLELKDASKVVDLGTCLGESQISLAGGASSSRTVTMNRSANLGNLSVFSEQAGETVTLETKGLSITGDSIYVGRGGVLDARGSTIVLSGGLRNDTGRLITNAATHLIKDPDRSCLSFFGHSGPIQTLASNTTHHHGFDVVHDSRVVMMNRIVDGINRTFLAYDSDNDGTQISLYYSDSIDGPWVTYSRNPVLGPVPAKYRDPTVVYDGATIHMFVTEMASKQIARYTSTDGVNFSFAEYILRIGYYGGTSTPYAFRDPNGGNWVLLWFDSVGYSPRQDYTYMREAKSISDLDVAQNQTLMKHTEDLVRAYPTMMFWNGRYWLAVEGRDAGQWWAIYVFSSTSLRGPYVEISADPVFDRDEACPRFLVRDSDTAYIFVQFGSSPVSWYVRHYQLRNNTIEDGFSAQDPCAIVPDGTDASGSVSSDAVLDSVGFAALPVGAVALGSIVNRFGRRARWRNRVTAP